MKCDSKLQIILACFCPSQSKCFQLIDEDNTLTKTMDVYSAIDVEDAIDNVITSIVWHYLSDSVE